MLLAMYIQNRHLFSMHTAVLTIVFIRKILDSKKHARKSQFPLLRVTMNLKLKYTAIA